MARVIWSPGLIEDLESILGYIERTSPDYARAVGQQIVDAIEAIGDFPESGSIVPEFNDLNLREKFVFRYRLIYRVREDAVIVLTIHHGNRELGDLT